MKYFTLGEEEKKVFKPISIQIVIETENELKAWWEFIANTSTNSRGFEAGELYRILCDIKENRGL